jgi:hypothetical protein
MSYKGGNQVTEFAQAIKDSDFRPWTFLKT